jgi:23S rRNA (cytidine1920-2'-O)/16S rRNA (cytidine1409-2'-O)-methyltransferase
MERTNARHLESLAEPVSLVVIDVAFISLRLILPAVKRWLTTEADIVALVKPQFEAGRSQVGKGGVVKDTAVHRQVVADMIAWCQENGLFPAGVTRSSIVGADGNVEFLLWLRPHLPGAVDIDTLEL